MIFVYESYDRPGDCVYFKNSQSFDRKKVMLAYINSSDGYNGSIKHRFSWNMQLFKLCY